MAVRKPLDRTPGAIPQVEGDGESVIFRFEVAGFADNTKLVLRCDVTGGVWVSITVDPDRPGTRPGEAET